VKGANRFQDSFHDRIVLLQMKPARFDVLRVKRHMFL
jgi:hypothetical protein